MDNTLTPADKFIYLELIIVIYIAIVLIVIEHYILISAEQNPEFQNLNHPKYHIPINIVEILWIIIVILKIYSWYRAKKKIRAELSEAESNQRKDFRQFVSVDLLLITSLIFALFYVFMFYQELKISNAFTILIFAFVFSLYYMYYMFQIDKISGIISIVLSVWLLVLLTITYQYKILNPEN